VLGVIPSEKYSDIPKHTTTGSVRSIRRAPGGGDIQVILIRLDILLPTFANPGIPDLLFSSVYHHLTLH